MTIGVVTILVAVGVMLVLAIIMSWILGWANDAFRVEVNPKVTELCEVLPGANCGACGFAGCNEYATKLVEGKAQPGACTQCNKKANQLISKILGCDSLETFPYKAVIHCNANSHQRTGRRKYKGEQTCAAASLLAGVQDCTFGCLGLGDCMRECPNDAIVIEDGLARVKYHNCIGCKKCEVACPRHIISIVPFRESQILVVACSNREKGMDVKGVCKVGCIGCGACQKNNDLIHMGTNLPTIDYSHYREEDGLDVVIEKCPAKMLIYVGEPTEEDIQATENEPMEKIVNPPTEEEHEVKFHWTGSEEEMLTRTRIRSNFSGQD